MVNKPKHIDPAGFRWPTADELMAARIWMQRATKKCSMDIDGTMLTVTLEMGDYQEAAAVFYALANTLNGGYPALLILPSMQVEKASASELPEEYSAEGAGDKTPTHEMPGSKQ